MSKICARCERWHDAVVPCVLVTAVRARAPIDQIQADARENAIIMIYRRRGKSLS